MSLRDKLRILVVDDMSTSRGLIVQTLDSFGIQSILSEESGPAALESLETTPVHLVISDYHMPNMDGLSLLENIRLNERTKGLGFILITGRANQEIVDRGHRLKMNNFIQKPFEPVDLRKCIEAVVGPI